MPADLKSNSYGKSRVRVAKITRVAGRHDFSDLTVDIRLEGSFEQSYLTGDNSRVIATDTMKNTVYVLAKQHSLDPIEGFGRAIAEHFLKTYEHVSSARIEIQSHDWRRLASHAFEHGEMTRLARITASRSSLMVEAGITNLVLLKTTDSAFEGFIRDRYTTLKETKDRILATAVAATWIYPPTEIDYNASMSTAIRVLRDTFAAHRSKAVQETLYSMGHALLEAQPHIAEVTLTLPNRHYVPADLSPFGLENANEVFVPTDEPHGLIEATLRRT